MKVEIRFSQGKATVNLEGVVAIPEGRLGLPEDPVDSSQSPVLARVQQLLPELVNEILYGQRGLKSEPRLLGHQ